MNTIYIYIYRERERGRKREREREMSVDQAVARNLDDTAESLKALIAEHDAAVGEAR